MANYYVGEIMLWPLAWAPVGWQICDGTLLQIDQYDVLYAVIGTTYGGNGTTNFAVPDMRGRVPVHRGQGGGLQNYTVGQQGGAAQVTLTGNTLPPHTHPLTVSGNPGTAGTPTGGAWLASTGPGGGTNKTYVAPGGSTISLNVASVGAVGGGQPHNNVQPSLAMNYLICTSGLYPPPP